MKNIRFLTLTKIGLFLIILSVTFVVLSTPISAEGKPFSTGAKVNYSPRPIEKPTYSARPVMRSSFTPRPFVIPSNKPLVQGRLRACQVKEEIISKRLTQVGNGVFSVEIKFDSIAKRVEDYYQTKVLTGGKVVPNYSALVSEIETKKLAVQTALNSQKNNVRVFDCTGYDPKGQLTQFRTDTQEVRSALKEYRTSIKNLIVAIRSITGEESREKLGSPRPVMTRLPRPVMTSLPKFEVQ